MNTFNDNIKLRNKVANWAESVKLIISKSRKTLQQLEIQQAES